MKRALIVLLSLAVAGGLFAQVSFGGNVNSGLLVGFDEDGHAFYTSKSDGGDKLSYGFSVTYAAPSGNAGANFAMTGNDGGGWNADGSKIWFKPLPILELSGGGGANGSIGTPGPGGTSNGASDKGVGLSVRLDPMPGLAFGLGIEPKATELGKAFYGLGLKYDLAGLFGAVANLGYDGAGNEGDGKVDAAAGVSVAALSNIAGLNIAANVKAGNVTKLADDGAVNAGAEVGFKVADLGATLKGIVALPVTTADKDAGKVLNAVIGADLSYPIGAITAKLGVGYLLKGAVTPVEDADGNNVVAPKFDPGMWAGIDGVGPADKDVESSVLKINPSISFKVAEADLNIGYGLKTNVGGESKINHEIYTGFSIGF